MRLVASLLISSLAAVPAMAADRIIGAVTPDGGALLVKRFAVPSGTTIAGVQFVSNDLGTVFPKVALLRGPATKLSTAEQLVEFTTVQARGSHHITLRFSPLHFQAASEVYLAVTMPPSNGIVEYKEGAGIPAAQIDAPADCYFASGLDADLGPMDVDYEMNLVFDQQPGKTNPGHVEDQARPRMFLHAAAPNPTSGATVVTFGLAWPADAHVAVYDITGRQVRVLAHEALRQGLHVRNWDGRDSQGHRVAVGIYLVRLMTMDKVLTQKLVVMK